jgi:hypothetical protein
MNMKRLFLLLGIAVLLATATSAFAMIGQTPDQVIKHAQRDRDIIAVDAKQYGGKPTLEVVYRDGTRMTHVFGMNGREISFYLMAPKRLTDDDVKAMQRQYRTTWRGTGTFNGVFSWESGSNLYMGESRHESFDLLTILDQSRMEEIISATLKEHGATSLAAAMPASPAQGGQELPRADLIVSITKGHIACYGNNAATADADDARIAREKMPFPLEKLNASERRKLVRLFIEHLQVQGQLPEGVISMIGDKYLDGLYFAFLRFGE